MLQRIRGDFIERLEEGTNSGSYRRFRQPQKSGRTIGSILADKEIRGLSIGREISRRRRLQSPIGRSGSCSVAKKMSAHVIGDGSSTIKELIELTNQDLKREDEHENILTKIKLNEETQMRLEN